MEVKMIKRKISIFLISMMIAALYCYIKAEPGTRLLGYTIKSSSMEQIQQGISGKIMRFHVVANSDSAADQELKLKVKEAVVSYISPVLKESENINRSKEILAEKQEEILALAQQVIRDNGYDYPVTVGFEYTYFPTKSYGSYTFPPGEYEAFMIRIGKSQGKNWWCVLYPPLCFIDISHGVVDQECGGQLEEILTTEEFSAVSGEHIGFRFKYLTFLNDIFGL
ncbi:MAG: stage II sporulation protein R [Lachnospiraceae bacterium]|nr:stage II sporulation protein R [Lachnospiraceae bacterium]